MRNDSAPVIRLDEYRPSDFLIDRVELDFRLHPTATRVTATLALRPNPQGRSDAPLIREACRPANSKPRRKG
jgi:aminopeptidase N